MASEEQFAGEEHAKLYSRYRKDIPAMMAEKIISYLQEKYDGPLDMAVDVCCGSGQSTVILSPLFKKVHGLDVSVPQVEEAKRSRARPNITYEVAPAEVLPFPDNSVQLVTACSALHWLDMDAFFEQVRRVLCNNGILAVYGYNFMKPVLDDPNLATKFDLLYSEFNACTSSFFAPQIHSGVEGYINVHFPFEEVIRIPDVRDIFDGYMSDIVGYVSTHSGFQNLKKTNPQKAADALSKFDNGLKEIAAACHVSTDESMKMYREFLLIICRKVSKPSQS